MEFKKIIIFGLFFVFICISFCGCIDDTDEENGKVEDTDNNGESSLLTPFNDNWTAEWADDTECDVATDIMIKVDSNDHPRIIAGKYENKSYCDLRYSYYDNGWHNEIVPYDSPFYGEEANIDLDSNDNPHIIFVDETVNEVYYGTKDNNWSFELVEKTPSFVLNTGIVLDSNENPHVIYDTCGAGDDYAYPEGEKPEEGNHTFRYAYKENNEWIVDVITQNAAVGRSIVVDSNDKPHTAFFRDDSVYYAYKNESWHMEELEGMRESSDVDIALDSMDNPHLIYKSSNDELRYAYYDSGWNFETLDEDSGPQQGVRIVIDENDVIHVYYSFCDEENTEGNNLYAIYMYKDEEWHTENVCYGGEGDIDVDNEYNPHICFGLAKPDSDEECEIIRYAYRK